VIYDAGICMGCRYCMMACPFGMTRYEWESANPRIRKCIMCYDKVVGGELKQPACTAACPKEATIFGERDALLAEAWRRINAEPDKYVQHVWGEHEVGGTSVLYISDVDLKSAGWPTNLDDERRPELARKVLHTVFPTFFSVALGMYGLHWIIERRQKLAAPPPGEAAEASEEAQPSEADQSETGEASE
jgi:formate dehydrogenase iron-sulfur subunit